MLATPPARSPSLRMRMGSSSPFVRRQARAVPVRSERAEAGVGSLHSFVSSFERCEDHVARSHRVT